MPVAVWDVFWVPNCRHTRPVPKGKYVIIIATNPQILGFMISSDPPRNLDPESEIALCYAGISRADTEPSFLRHNSIVVQKLYCVNVMVHPSYCIHLRIYIYTQVRFT